MNSAALRLASLPRFRDGGQVQLRDYQDGGRVFGRGGPTSDTVHAMLSPGEIVMPADTVKAVGAAQLLATIDATHTPSGKPSPKVDAQFTANDGQMPPKALTALQRMASLAPVAPVASEAIEAVSQDPVNSSTAARMMATLPGGQSVPAFADGGQVTPVNGTGRTGYVPDWTISADQSPVRPALPAPAPSSSTALQAGPTRPNFTMGGNPPPASPAAPVGAPPTLGYNPGPQPQVAPQAAPPAASQPRAVPSGQGTSLVPIAGTGDNGYRPNFTMGGQTPASATPVASGMDASRGRVNGQIRNAVDAMSDVGGTIKGTAGRVAQGVGSILDTSVARGAGRLLGAVDSLENLQQTQQDIDNGDAAGALNSGSRGVASALSLLSGPVGSAAAAYSVGNAAGGLLKSGMERTKSGQGVLDTIGGLGNSAAKMLGGGVDTTAMDQVNSPGYFQSGKAPAPVVPKPQTSNAATAPVAAQPRPAPSPANAQEVMAQPKAAPEGVISYDPKTRTYSGSNISPGAEIMGGRGGGGMISAQSQTAAQRLSDLSSAESLARVTQSTASNPAQQPLVLSSQQDPWSARKAMENAATTASSIHAPTAARGAAELATLRSDQQLALREDAATARTSMTDAGQTTRARIQEAGANSRYAQSNLTTQQKLALERTAAGYQNRAADRLEAAQQALLSATTPEARKAAADNLRSLAGKEPPNRFTVVPGGQVVDPVTNAVRTLPSRVLDNETRTFMDDAQSPPKQPTVSVGARTSHPDGQFAMGDKTVTIKNGVVSEVK